MVLSPSEKNNYRHLVAEMEEEVRRLSVRHGHALKCRPGCSRCCIPFSVSPLEAGILREAVDNCCPAGVKAVIRSRQERDDDGACPFLVNDLCSVYEARPVICRSHGLPLAYVDDEHERIEVSVCAINFGPEAAFIPDDLLFMDTFNARLAALNSAYCHARGVAPHIRIPLREISLALG